MQLSGGAWFSMLKRGNCWREVARSRHRSTPCGKAGRLVSFTGTQALNRLDTVQVPSWKASYRKKQQ